jgi:tripartite-type tricarboxylate transporter receptor subunit TctC
MLCLRAGLYREYTPIKVILATLQEQAMSKPTGMRLATFVRSAHLGATRLVVTVLAVMLPAAHAENYPSKPLRLVVGLPAGGGADAIARIIASKLSDNVAQPVIVENRPGSAARIAADTVARSNADGYTLLFGASIARLLTSE